MRANPATKDIAVLMVTALDQASDIERAVEAGTGDLVSKPVNKDTLLSRVRSLLASHQRLEVKQREKKRPAVRS